MSRGDVVLVGGIVLGLVALAVVVNLMRGDLHPLQELAAGVADELDEAVELIERLEQELGGIRTALPGMVDAALAEREGYARAAAWPTAPADDTLDWWVDDLSDLRELAATGTGWPS